MPQMNISSIKDVIFYSLKFHLLKFDRDAAKDDKIPDSEYKKSAYIKKIFDKFKAAPVVSNDHGKPIHMVNFKHDAIKEIMKCVAELGDYLVYKGPKKIKHNLSLNSYEKSKSLESIHSERPYFEKTYGRLLDAFLITMPDRARAKAAHILKTQPFNEKTFAEIVNL